MSRYKYKKEFLGEFMRRKGLSSYALKDVLGIKSTNHIDVWTGKKPLPELGRPKEDQGWLPLVHILKICNTYPEDVTLGDFIEGADEADLIRESRSAVVPKEDYQRLVDKKNQEIAALQQKLSALKVQLAELKAAHEKNISTMKDQLHCRMMEREDKIRRECDERIMEIIRNFASGRNTNGPDDRDGGDMTDSLLANEPIEPPRP